MPAHPVDPFAEAYAYEQVADDLARRITAGEFKTGDRLPGERELAAEYEVGYVTARHAVQLLRERGTVKTAKTRGSFVAGGQT